MMPVLASSCNLRKGAAACLTSGLSSNSESTECLAAKQCGVGSVMVLSRVGVGA